MLEVNVSKIDKFNGKNSAKSCSDFVGEELTLKGVFSFEDEVANNETGEVEVKEIVCLVTDQGCIASPSATLCQSTHDLVDIFGDDIVGMSIKIVGQKSNAGRTYYRLEVVA